MNCFWLPILLNWRFQSPSWLHFFIWKFPLFVNFLFRPFSVLAIEFNTLASDIYSILSMYWGVTDKRVFCAAYLYSSKLENKNISMAWSYLCYKIIIRRTVIRVNFFIAKFEVMGCVTTSAEFSILLSRFVDVVLCVELFLHTLAIWFRRPQKLLFLPTAGHDWQWFAFQIRPQLLHLLFLWMLTLAEFAWYICCRFRCLISIMIVIFNARFGSTVSRNSSLLKSICKKIIVSYCIFSCVEDTVFC